LAIQASFSPYFSWSPTADELGQSVQVVPQVFIREGDRAFSLTGSVPEPATWAMLITGFAGVGAMIRRKRVLAAV
jgi:hypothetical protein